MNALVIALMQIEEMLADVVLMPRHGGAKANERISLLITRQLQFLTEHPGLPTLLFTRRLYTDNDELKLVMQKILTRYIHYLESIIRQGIEEKTFHLRGDVHECAILLSALMQGVVFQCFLNDSLNSLNGYAESLTSHILSAVEYRDGSTDSGMDSAK